MNPTLNKTISRDDQGAVLVEFAVVATILMTVLVGILVFGVAWTTKTQVAGWARDGARAMSLRQTSQFTDVQTRASSVGVTVTVPPTSPVATCPAGDSTNQIDVQASKNVPFKIPFWPGSATTKNISETVRMRCGG